MDEVIWTRQRARCRLDVASFADARLSLHRTIRGFAPWQEFDLMGKTLAIGDARLKIIKRIVRCAATNVDPQRGVRDMNIPLTLEQRFGHMDCGAHRGCRESAEDRPARR